MALALGLGSLFNHSEHPNVSYSHDTSTESIRYTTVRDVAPDEELCIFYGHNLWFSSAEDLSSSNHRSSHYVPDEPEDGWGGLSAVEDDDAGAGADLSLDTDADADVKCPYLDGDPSEIISDEDLPFTRFKLPPDEEDLASIRTVDAWVVDIPDPRHITKMLKWLKQANLETPDLGHLKRIRKLNDAATLLLATTTTSPHAPSPPIELELPDPYLIKVPSAPALTPTQLKLKSSLWPTLFTPPRKGEAEQWSRGRARWAWEGMRTAVLAAREAGRRGELPIAAHIAAPYEEDAHGDANSSQASYTAEKAPVVFTASDTRQSNAHPLRHAIINVVRQMADYRASSSSSSSAATLRASSPPAAIPATASSDSVPSSPQSVVGDSEAEAETEARNGSNYLLTSLTVFTTYEPCIMCSMALIHSRAKEVVYLKAMPRTGGCGGAACLPTLKGVNHRFGICVWKEDGGGSWGGRELYVDENVDA
ncbi:hypothetical protein DXG03_004877 [Asterophora parasitica]|uniref:Cytidine deaminase-like protein n=1 Tax=Asterophora parasitica TaxID=117018 RepID=A0A9P7GFD5_9AGAR|nr:hypothetical protein DXG03_004877 [Asterophora parasitica]